MLFKQYAYKIQDFAKKKRSHILIDHQRKKEEPFTGGDQGEEKEKNLYCLVEWIMGNCVSSSVKKILWFTCTIRNYNGTATAVEVFPYPPQAEAYAQQWTAIG